MKKKAYCGGISAFCFMFMAASLCWAGDNWQDLGREILNVRAVIVDPASPKVIYLGSEKGIFKSQDSGGSWRNIFLTKGTKVNLLLFDPGNSNIIYAATGSGLFYSVNKGRKWDRIFKGKNCFEADCLTIVVLPGAIYLGTRQGLFASKDKGRSWHKEQGRLRDAQIFNIVYSLKNPALLYLASTDGVFKSIDSGSSWERVFVTHLTEDEKEDDNGYEDQDEETRHSEIRYLAIDPDDPEILFLATSRGIYQSKDSGVSWKSFPEYGLLSRDINFLLFSEKSRFYCAGKSGIFIYRDSGWQGLALPISFGRVNFIALDKGIYLYACLDKGLFRLNLSDNSTGADILKGYSDREPTISEVQKAAIEYAEVNPEKIIRWRKQVSKKAWLPSLKLNFGRNTTDLWHWEGGSTVKASDDELRRGKDTLDWDVSVSWDLSELVWSSHQTSIDVRSRLMVQLRDDILDEVNKLYFERIRVKMELDNLAIEDRKRHFEKELRIRELTASLDALTGGYFFKASCQK